MSTTNTDANQEADYPTHDIRDVISPGDHLAGHVRRHVFIHKVLAGFEPAVRFALLTVNVRSPFRAACSRRSTSIRALVASVQPHGPTHCSTRHIYFAKSSYISHRERAVWRLLGAGRRRLVLSRAEHHPHPGPTRLPISPHCLYDGRGMIPCLKIKKADVRPLSRALPIELPSDLQISTGQIRTGAVTLRQTGKPLQ